MKHLWQHTATPRMQECKRCGCFRRKEPPWEKNSQGGRIFCSYRFPGQAWTTKRPECYQPAQAVLSFEDRSDSERQEEEEDPEGSALKKRYPTVPSSILNHEFVREAFRIFPKAKMQKIRYPKPSP